MDVPLRFENLEVPPKIQKIFPDFVCFSMVLYNKHFYFGKSDGNFADILAKMSLS